MKYGANPHVEDKNGHDVCDKAQGIERYDKIKVFSEYKCKDDRSVRIAQGSNALTALLSRAFKREIKEDINELNEKGPPKELDAFQKYIVKQNEEAKAAAE
jgi:hypothetical protein